MVAEVGRGAGRRVSEIRARAARPGTGRTILNLAVGACVSPTDSIITTCALLWPASLQAIPTTSSPATALRGGLF